MDAELKEKIEKYLSRKLRKSSIEYEDAYKAHIHVAKICVDYFNKKQKEKQ